MRYATLTSKGQITVPKHVREMLGVQAGDRLAFRVRGDGSVVVEAETADLRALRGTIRTAVKGVTIEQMNETIRRSGGRG